MGYFFRSLPENPFPLILCGDGTYAVVEPDAWSRANAQIPVNAVKNISTPNDPRGISALMGSLRYSGSHISKIEAITKHAKDYADEEATYKQLLKTLPVSALSFKISAMPDFNKKTRSDFAFCAIKAFLYSSSKLTIISSNGNSADTIFLVVEKPGKLKSFFTTGEVGRTLLAIDPGKIRDVEVSLKKVVVHFSGSQSLIARDTVIP